MQRRNFIKGIGIAGMLPLQTLAAQPASTTNSYASPTPVFFKKEANEFRFLNILGKAHYKFADIGELLAIRDAVNEDNPLSFVNAYVGFADKCQATAAACLQRNHRISARDAWFRASTYYSAALEYLDEAMMADKFLALFKMHRHCWQSGVKLMDLHYEEFEILYESRSIKGFFIRHKGDATPRPLCVFNNGSDGTILDWWTMGGAGMLERGYNLMTFDGPGQGSSLFERNMYFRYDWEHVITAVIDSVIGRKDVDRNKIFLYGISQGGYWAPRAAAFEKRLKALIADPGVMDVSISWRNSLPKEMTALLDAGDKDRFNGYMAQGFKQNPASAALYNFRARPYGIDNPYDTYKSVEQYRLDKVAGKITCPVLIASPEDEAFWPGQSQQLYDLVKSSRQMVTFSGAQGANFHCEPKARIFWEQQVLDRLDEVLHR